MLVWVSLQMFIGCISSSEPKRNLDKWITSWFHSMVPGTASIICRHETPRGHPQVSESETSRTDAASCHLTSSAGDSSVQWRIFFNLFIYLKSREAKKEGVIVYFLVHSPKGCQSWIHLKPGTMSFFCISYMGEGAQALGQSDTAFPSSLAGSWSWVGVARTWTCVLLECQHCKWQPYPLCHSAGPSGLLLPHTDTFHPDVGAYSKELPFEDKIILLSTHTLVCW